MHLPSRTKLFAAAAMLSLPLAVLATASQQLGSAQADDRARDVSTPASPSSGSTAQGLKLGSEDGTQPENMEQFLTAVTKDVDSHWTGVFEDSGLPEPRVNYEWIPAGQTAASACGDESGAMGDDAAAYCPGEDTLYISQKFATDIYDGTLDRALPGSSQGYGKTAGDFAVAYIVAHEYAHQVQDELGLLQGDQRPATVNIELQADCYAGTWAKSAYDENRLEDGDVQEALDAALAVGDFDASNPSHHGTPEQRKDAWNSGFQSGDPSSCGQYLDGADGADAGATASLHLPSIGYVTRPG